MSDHDDRQAPAQGSGKSFAFSDAFRAIIHPDHKTIKAGAIKPMPEAHDGVSAVVMRAVWQCYATYADADDGSSAYPSYSTVSKLTGCSVRQVQRAVIALTDTGWLIKTHEATKVTPAIYTVRLKGIDILSPHDTLSPDNTSTHDTLSIDDMTPCHLTTRHEVTPCHGGIDTLSWGYRQGGLLPTHIPTQEPAVDARGSAAPTTTQQVEGKLSTLERIDRYLCDLDLEEVARGIYLLTKTCGHDFNQKQCSSIAFTLKSCMFEVDEIKLYIGEKLAAHADTPTSQACKYIASDASRWLVESRDRSRLGVDMDGPTYALLVPTEDVQPDYMTETPDLTEEEKQAIRDQFDEILKNGGEPWTFTRRA